MNRPYMNSGSPCWTCHAQTDYYILNKLNEIERVTESVRARHDISAHVRPSGERIAWNVNKKCQYNMECPEIRNFNMRCNNIITRISPFVAYIAKHADDDGCVMDAYNEILALCSGNFPSVCTQMVHMRETERDRRNREWKASQHEAPKKISTT